MTDCLRFLIFTPFVFAACTSNQTNKPATPPLDKQVESAAQTAVATQKPPEQNLACGDDLGSFSCQQKHWCDESLPADGIDAVHLLCAAASISSTPDNVLRPSDFLASLPANFTRNFVLKHGREELGARGHAFERMEDIVSPRLAAQSQSARPELPRVIFWDDISGLSIAYNGGVDPANGDKVTGGDRLDIHTFDQKTATFEMWALDLPIVRGADRNDKRWLIQPFIPNTPDDNCTTCHGPHRRPIWPMYPDWPGFYGSDNDELGSSSVAQKREQQELANFRLGLQNAPKKSDPRRRYSTLFSNKQAEYLQSVFTTGDTNAVRDYLKQRAAGDASRPLRLRLSPAAKIAFGGTDEVLQRWLGLELHAKYPLRPNEELRLTEASRAFFHRPNLRIGLLDNRLLALHIAARIKESPLYQAHRELIVSQVLDCAPTDERKTQVQLQLLVQKAQPYFSALGLATSPKVGSRLTMPVLLALFGLQVRDIDIRFTYTNPSFEPFDLKNAVNNLPPAPSIMALGTLSYEKQDYNQDNRANNYFNSYWDGSATIIELLAAQLVVDLKLDSTFFRLNSLTRKYGELTSRQLLDARFLSAMDKLSGWFPLPYPKAIEDVHHRQSFHLAEGGDFPHRTQHNKVCAELNRRIGAAR
jgi:hypothetical protein